MSPWAQWLRPARRERWADLLVDRSATVGLVVKDNVVVDAPPYARRWALGRDARQLWREQAAWPGVVLVWLPDSAAAGGHG